MRRLHQAASGQGRLRARLRALPASARLQVGGLRVGVVHGDAESLAGWGFARQTIDDPAQRRRIDGWFEQARVDVFASSHTCEPLLRAFDGDRLVINNGAAGMPNFAEPLGGLLTRIGIAPAPVRPLYGTRLRGVHVDALLIDYERSAWIGQFLANWPPGSPAHTSYFERITRGTADSVAAALRPDSAASGAAG